jgi:uncharacterized protein (TIGR02147 family)
MATKTELPSVFEYLDYRRYLGDYFFMRKMLDPKFSIRAFAAKAGLPLSNSSFFSKVIAGNRNLTLDLQFKIAKALKLGASEIPYFGLLVRFNQSKDPESKNHLYSELAKYSRSKARIIDKDGYEYYAKWHNSIIRAFFGINHKENNPGVIGRKVFPQVPAKEVEETVRLLLDLGLISKTANGYSLKESNIATERENKDFVGKVRILEMLRLAQEVFNHVPPQDREFSAMTVFISKPGYAALQEKIRAFREELKTLVAADKDEDRIYTLGMQFFPNNVLPEWAGEGSQLNSGTTNSLGRKT